MNLLKKIENLVAKNSIEEALTELERHITSNYYDLLKEIVLLKSRVNDIKSRRNRGIVELKEEQIELNQIKHSILDIAKQLNEDQQQIVKSNMEIRVVEKNKRRSILSEYLDFLRPNTVIPFLFLIGIIYSVRYIVLHKDENPFFPEEPALNAKFYVLIDKNKFYEAESFLDSVYQSNPIYNREAKKKEIFSKKLDFFLMQNQADSILFAIKNYRFKYVFPDDGLSKSDMSYYNQETFWIDNEIEKIITRLCKTHKSHAYLIIETCLRPKAGDYDCNSAGGNCKFYKDYSKKGKLAQAVNECH